MSPPSVAPNSSSQGNPGVSNTGTYQVNGMPWTSGVAPGTNPNPYINGTNGAPEGSNIVYSNGAQGVAVAGNYGGITPPPDQYANGVDISQVQQQQNAANRQNTTNQFGTNTNVFNPVTGQWTNTSQLSGPGQTLFQGAQGLANSAVGDMTGGLDTSQLTPWGTAPTYSGATAQQGANDAYAYAKGNLDPQWNQNQVQLQGQLAAQGLHPGDPAYEQQMRSFNAAKGTAYQQANLGSFATGAQEAATQTGAEATAANASNTMRMQQIQQQLTQAGWGANEIAQLLGNPAITGAPGATQSNPTQTGNNAATLSNAALQQQQMQNQMMNNLFGGASGAAGSLFGAGGGGAAAGGGGAAAGYGDEMAGMMAVA